MASAFRTRALYAGVASGALALAGVLVMRSSGLSLLHGSALVFVIISGVAGLGTLLLCWVRRFGLARLTAALAVAAVVVGWTVAQAPRLLPGLTVPQAAAGRSTLVALIIAVCVGAVVLVPSLVLLFTLFLRGRLDTPDHPVPSPLLSAAAPVAAPAPAPVPAPPLVPASPPPPGTRLRNRVRPSDSKRARRWTAAAVVGLVGGAGLLVFADAAWAHVLGVVLLVLCAVSVFTLAMPGPGQE
jgi:cytochrome d ubiquinol oxidase subunit II